jgi:hypothetical protein
MSEPPATTHDVFISYSSRDKPIADAVCATLEAKKVRCWIAPRDVLPGVPYAEALSDAITTSRLLVLVLSSGANNSNQVMREVEAAVAKGLPVVPFRIEDVQPSKSLNYFLKAIHWLDAVTPPVERHLQKLAQTVHLFLARPGTGPAAESAAPSIRAGAVQRNGPAATSTVAEGTADRRPSPPPGGFKMVAWLVAALLALTGLAVLFFVFKGSLFDNADGTKKAKRRLESTTRDGPVTAEELKSGPQVGQKIPGPFHPLNVTSKHAGKKFCQVGRHGNKPVAMIFAREVTNPVIRLIKEIDTCTRMNMKGQMGSFVVFLNDREGLEKELKELADRENIKYTVLTIDSPSGPLSYQIAKDAEVTVVLYTKWMVKANYAFKKGALKDKDIEKIIADVKKILPDR